MRRLLLEERCKRCVGDDELKQVGETGLTGGIAYTQFQEREGFLKKGEDSKVALEKTNDSLLGYMFYFPDFSPREMGGS